MKFTSDNKISDELLHNFNEEETFALAKKLEVETDTKSYKIQNFDLLRSLVISKTELTFDYIHLLGRELFDDN